MWSCESFGSGQFDPLFGGKEEAVAARLISNSLEFEGIKIGIIDALPDAKEQDGVFVFEPLLDECTSSVEVPHTMSVREM